MKLINGWLEESAYKAWYGPLRRPFRKICGHVLNPCGRILLGILRGKRFVGNRDEIPCRLGIFELEIQHAIAQSLEKGDIFFDVGANNGYLSMLGAILVGKDGLVFAFEPLPENVKRMHTLLAENFISNVMVVPQAVSNAEGEVGLFFIDGEVRTPSLIQGRRVKRICVLSMTLDNFVNEQRWPALIKVDVEGAEVLVLQGAISLLSHNKAPDWIIEVHSKDKDAEVRDILISNDYRIKNLVTYRRRDSYPLNIYARKK